MLFLMILETANMGAQVRIGGSEAPNEAAVLDLNVTDKAIGTKGLALPRVDLTDNTVEITSGVANLKGMLVYNTTAALGEGVYYWSGSQWVKVTDSSTYSGSASIDLTNGEFRLKALTGDVTTAANSVATTIGSGKVTKEKIAVGAVDSAQLAAAAIWPTHIAKDAITTAKIADKAVTLSKISVSPADSNMVLVVGTDGSLNTNSFNRSWYRVESNKTAALNVPVSWKKIFDDSLKVARIPFRLAVVRVDGILNGDICTHEPYGVGELHAGLNKIDVSWHQQRGDTVSLRVKCYRPE
ncbi:hypothetical protein NO1_2246 [Candidatus Termititenax aidoneus]|uniref:Uncharacterized protein n=1 Tax=Termititenax aidoneus TaxID=2218524 RepID=A0A388TEK9_TERA1|nr:hypothetical protein NO1_2246 [Candidatus Termititenax aidoneus]